MIHNMEPVTLSTEAQAALAERRSRLQSIELAQRARTNPLASEPTVIVIEDDPVPETNTVLASPQEEDDPSCPVCLETPQEFKTLFGCGHKVCLPCEENLKNTTHQHRMNDVLKKKFAKCPICRAFEKPCYEDLEKELVFWRDYSRKLVMRQPPRPTPPAAPQRSAAQERVRVETIRELANMALTTSQQPIEQVAAQITARIADYNRTVAAPQRTIQMETIERIVAIINTGEQPVEQIALQINGPIADYNRTVAAPVQRRQAERGRPTPLRRVRCNGRSSCLRITQSRCHTCRTVQCCKDCISCTTCRQRIAPNIVTN